MKDKVVIGPLTIKQFMTIFMSSAFAYGSYLYLGYNYQFFIIVGVLIVGSLIYLKYGG